MLLLITIILSLVVNLNGAESFNSYAIILPSDPKANGSLHRNLNKIAKENDFIAQGNKHMTLLLFKIKSDYRKATSIFIEQSVQKQLSTTIKKTVNKILPFSHIEQMGNYIAAIFEVNQLAQLRQDSFNALRLFFQSFGFVERKEDRDKKGIWYIYYDAKTGKQTGELLESFMPHVSFIFLNPDKPINAQKIQTILNKKINDSFTLTTPLRISEKTINFEPRSMSILPPYPELLSNILELKNQFNILKNFY